jgi:hypothetical protein
MEVRILVFANGRRVERRDGPTDPHVQRLRGVDGKKFPTLGEWHDVLAEQNVSASDTRACAEEIDLVCPFVIAIASDAKKHSELTMLLKAFPMNLLGSNVRQAAPAFENTEVGVRTEKNEVSASRDHLLGVRCH